jgi:hypothetical protein
MEIIETVDAKAPVKKKPVAKKKVAGRGNPGKAKSQAHKDAISAALKAYHASKKKGSKSVKPASTASLRKAYDALMKRNAGKKNSRAKLTFKQFVAQKSKGVKEPLGKKVSISNVPKVKVTDNRKNRGRVATKPKTKKSAIDKAKATIKKAGGIIKNNGRLKAMTALDKKKRQKRLMDLQKLRTEIKNLQETIKRIKASKISPKSTVPMENNLKKLKAKAQKIRSGT